MIKKSDIEAVVAPSRRIDVCDAFAIVLPILKRLSNRKIFLIRWVLRGLVAAIEEYRSEVCKGL